jgi:uncharacterized protein (TIRG00374 family)
MTSQKKTFLLKTVISLTLILIIFSKIDLGGLAQVVTSMNMLLFIVSCMVLFVQQLIMVKTWSILIQSKNNDVPFYRVLYAHVVGNFFGMFLPSAVGMDVIRAYNLSRHMKDRIDSASSLFLCRAIGFVVLFCLALAFAFPVARLTDESDIFLSLSVSLVLFLAFIFIIYHPKVMGWIKAILDRVKANSVAEWAIRFHKSIIELSKKGSVLFKVFGMAIVFQILGILELYILGLALDIPVEVGYYFIFIPVIFVVTLLPISLAGFGVREASFLYLFTRVGATEVQSISLSLLMFLQVLILAVIGGIVYWAEGASRGS